MSGGVGGVVGYPGPCPGGGRGRGEQKCSSRENTTGLDEDNLQYGGVAEDLTALEVVGYRSS